MASLLIAVIYLVFISLGLPDSLLGSGWPKMQEVFGVDGSYAGYVSMTICAMTILSALLSPKLIKKIHTKWIIVVSIFLTIVGLLGFSFVNQYWMLFLCAIPYGLGAGAIDASINHYVSENYSSRVMNFLHCFYGVGAVISPSIMALALKVARYNEGYRWTSYVQIGILIVCILSFPLWNKQNSDTVEVDKENVKIKDSLKEKGVILTLIAFFSYCAAEATCFLWVPSYFKNAIGGLSEQTIASFGSLIFLGLMIGRIISGIISKNVNDRNLIRLGFSCELFGIIILILFSLVIRFNYSYVLCAIAFVIIGMGMGPIYPSIQHMAPINFSKKHSANVIGLQMASAYIGSTFMPMIFGNISKLTSMKIMPFYLLLFALLNIGLLELTYRKIKR